MSAQSALKSSIDVDLSLLMRCRGNVELTLLDVERTVPFCSKMFDEWTYIRVCTKL